MRVRVHVISTSLVHVFDKAQVERTATILVALELGDCSLCCFDAIESNDSGASRAATWFVLDLSLFNLANCSEQVDKIFVAGRPGKLQSSSQLQFEGRLTVEKQI